MRTVLLPLADYPTGTRAIPEFAIADAAIQGSIELSRCTTATPDLWPNAATLVTFALEISLDARATWQPAGSFTARGGIILGRGGVEEAIYKAIWSWPAGSGRFVRGTVTIVNGPLRTTGTVEVL